MGASPAICRSGGCPYALVWSPIPLISWLLPCIGHIGVCSSSGRTYDFAGPFTVNEDELLFGQPTRYLTLANGAPGVGSGRRDSVQVAAGLEGDPETALQPLATTAAGGAGSGGLAGTAVASASPPWWEDNAGQKNEPSGHGGDDVGVASSGSGLTGKGPGAAGGSQSWDHRLAFAATTYRLLNYNIMTNNCHCFVAHFLNQMCYKGGGWDMVNLAALMFVQGRYTSLGALLYTWLPWVLLVGLGGFFGGAFFFLCYAAVCVPLVAWFLFYTWCCWRDLRF